MIPFLASPMFQNQILRGGSYSSIQDETETKKQYYKLLNFKPMFIKLNVSSHGSQFLPQLVNLSMIKEIRGGFTELNGVSPDKWCAGECIDGSDIWIEGSLDEIQSKIWKEQEINK
jgi:hypothetical protein